MITRNAKLLACIALGLSVLIVSARLLAQGAPITGNALVALGGTIDGQQGSVLVIPLNVDLTSVTAVDENIVTVPAVLSNYRIAISYDNTLVKARNVGGVVVGGTTPEFSADANANIITNGTSDTLVVMQTQLNNTSPVGLINFAQVEFDILTSTPTVASLTVSVLDLRTPIIFTGIPSQPVIGGEMMPSVVTNGAINILAAADTDGDGIPDVWESANGLNPDDDADALIDSDGDGLNNLNEYLNMIDPQDPDSDGDLVPDGAEVTASTDPNDDTSFPLWITSLPVTDGLELQPYQYIVLTNDAGVVFSLDQSPAGMAIDVITGVIGWTPSLGQTGDYGVTVRITKDTENATQNYILNIAEKGDINADGLVNAADLLLAQRHVLNQTTLDALQIERGDIYPASGDGQVTIQDLILISRKALGL